MPHRRRRRTAQSYSPDGANMPSRDGTWRQLANTIEPVLLSTHLSPNPNGKSLGSAIFFTAPGRVSSGIPGHVLSPVLIIAPSHGGSGPHLTHASLDRPESITKTACRLVFCTVHVRMSGVSEHTFPPSKLSLTIGISIPISNSGSLGPPDSAVSIQNGISTGSAVLYSSRACTAESRSLYNGRHSPKIAPFHGDLNLHLTHGSLGPPKLSTQTASRSVQPFLQAHYGNRRTHRQTTLYTVAVTGRINV